MGMFSYLCARSGLPIQADGAGDDGQSDVVYVAGGSTQPIVGTYDGYGRVCTANGEVHELPRLDTDDPTDSPGRLILKACFDGDVDAVRRLPPNKPDPWQGFVAPVEFIARMYQEVLAGRIDSAGYERYCNQFCNGHGDIDDVFARWRRQMPARVARSGPAASASTERTLGAADPAQAVRKLGAIRGWRDCEIEHAIASLGDRYLDEHVMHTRDTRYLHFGIADGQCDYVRVVEDGYELAYWTADEWRCDPQTVMAAIAVIGGARPR